MAQKITTLFIDDIDGGAAEGTVRFALDGTEYEIDLNAKHSEELRGVLGKYVSHGRKVGGSVRSSNAPRQNAMTAAQSMKARDWCRKNGFPEVKDRGRIPAKPLAAYNTAHGTSYVS